MRRYWWWIRLALFCIVFLALGIFLFHSTPWRQWLGASPDYSDEIARGDKIVAAVEAFRADCRLWPQYLEDLVPHYLDAIPDPGNKRHWFYELSAVPDDQAPTGFRTIPSLSMPTGDVPREHLGFDFDTVAPAWHLFGGNDEPRILRQAAPGTRNAPARPQREILTNALAELDRRIAREPRELEHRRAKAGLLLAAGQLAEARLVVQQAGEDLPDSYWPRLTDVVMNMPATNAPTSAPATSIAPVDKERLAAFAEWVQEHPSLTHWFYLSHLQRLADQPDAAANSMVKAAQQSIEVAADDPSISAYYLWDMARWALETRRLNLVTQITDMWELADKEKRVADASYLPIRSAARLSQGNPTGAKLDLDTLDGPPPRRTWARNIDGPSGLRDAITRNDRAYRYHPGPLPGPFNPFPVPE